MNKIVETLMNNQPSGVSFVKLPIRKLDNIDVKIFIRNFGRVVVLEITDKFDLRLFLKTISFDMSKTELPKIVNEYFDIIKKLKFCKFTGKFCENIEEINEENEEFINLFKNFNKDAPQVELTFGECCVCQEYTTTHLKCGCVNNLCVECYLKLEVIENQDEEDESFEKGIKCPCCRKLIEVNNCIENN